MAQVTTRTGDQGYTGLLGAERVPKFDDRIEALGLIDEATSALGVARASAGEARVRQIILDQQQTLYRLMAELATTSDAAGKLSVAPIGEADVAELERISAELKVEVDIGNRFVIPGETLSGATLDLARTIVRRAERQLVRMLHGRVVENGELVRYLNRLSDTLFILARFVERGHTREVL
jgi:cob(I)alamin adenosyltransferase